MIGLRDLGLLGVEELLLLACGEERILLACGKGICWEICCMLSGAGAPPLLAGTIARRALGFVAGE